MSVSINMPKENLSLRLLVALKVKRESKFREAFFGCGLSDCRKESI